MLEESLEEFIKINEVRMTVGSGSNSFDIYTEVQVRNDVLFYLGNKTVHYDEFKDFITTKLNTSRQKITCRTWLHKNARLFKVIRKGGGRSDFYFKLSDDGKKVYNTLSQNDIWGKV